MTKPKYVNPRSKVKLVRKESKSLDITIPEKIAFGIRLQAGDSLEWIWITEGFESYVKVRKVQDQLRQVFVSEFRTLRQAAL